MSESKVRAEMSTANQDLECSVISAMMMSPTAASKGLDLLLPEHFTDYRLARVLGAIRDVYSQAGAADPASVDAHLRLSSRPLDRESAEWLVNVAGGAYGVPVPSLIEHYCALLDELLVRRQRAAATAEAAELQALGDHEGAEAVLVRATQIRPAKRVLKDAATLEAEVAAEIDADIAARRVGWPTGYPSLDHLLGGLRPGRLVVLAGLPGVGKTAIATKIALSVGEAGGRVWYWSKEMPQTEITRRMAGQRAGVATGHAQVGRLIEPQRVALRQALAEVVRLPIYVDDTRSNIQQMGRQARGFRGDVKLFIVDHLQLVKVQGVSDMFSRVTEVMGDLKQMALDCNATVVVLSQFSREANYGTAGTPEMHQLKGSGAVEEDADVVAMIARDRKLQPGADGSVSAKLIVSKHRQGSPGEIALSWYPVLATYEEPR